MDYRILESMDPTRVCRTKKGVIELRLVILYQYLTSCLEGHEIPLLFIEEFVHRQHTNHL